MGATALQCGINGAKFGRSRGQEAILLEHRCRFGVEVYDHREDFGPLGSFQDFFRSAALV